MLHLSGPGAQTVPGSAHFLEQLILRLGVLLAPLLLRVDGAAQEAHVVLVNLVFGLRGQGGGEIDDLGRDGALELAEGGEIGGRGGGSRGRVLLASLAESGRKQQHGDAPSMLPISRTYRRLRARPRRGRRHLTEQHAKRRARLLERWRG